MLHKLIKDRAKLHSALREAGRPVPHHEDDEDGFNVFVNTHLYDVRTDAPIEDYSSHFDSSFGSSDSSTSSSTSDPVDNSPSFDSGGGSSGGGGADGSF